MQEWKQARHRTKWCSFLVNITWNSYKTQRSYGYFALNVKKNDEIHNVELFSKNYPEMTSQNDNIILDIIYAFILISETKDVEEAERIWKNFYVKPEVYDAGEAISQIDSVKELFKTITEKYPFTKLFFEKLIKEKIDAAKMALSKIDFLK